MNFFQGFIIVVGIIGIAVAVYLSYLLFRMVLWCVWIIGWKVLGAAYIFTWDTLTLLLFHFWDYRGSLLGRYIEKIEKNDQRLRWIGVLVSVILCGNLFLILLTHSLPSLLKFEFDWTGIVVKIIGTCAAVPLIILILEQFRRWRRGGWSYPLDDEFSVWNGPFQPFNWYEVE